MYVYLPSFWGAVDAPLHSWRKESRCGEVLENSARLKSVDVLSEIVCGGKPERRSPSEPLHCRCS